MTDVQIELLIEVLKNLGTSIEIASHTTYTLTGAADWNLVLVFGSGFILLIASMWRDLRATFKDHKTDTKDEINTLWNETRHLEAKFEDALKVCKEKCCE